MRRVILLSILAVATVVAAADGVRRRPLRGGIDCLLWGINCHPLRVYPADNYWLPRGAGVIAQGYLRAMQGHEILDDIAAHDIRIANLWIRADPFDGMGEWCWRPFLGEGPEMCDGYDEVILDDMHKVWTHPDFDVLIVRIERWGSLEEHCDDGKQYDEETAHIPEYYNQTKSTGRSLVWENEPTEDIVNKLYELYGNEGKIIIIQNWEADWQLHGVKCREKNECVLYGWWGEDCLDEFTIEECCSDLKRSRGNYLLRIFNSRQVAIRNARDQHRGSRLRVYHSIAINFFTDEWLTVARDIIPFMDEPPDLIGVSFWKKDMPITVALDYVEEHTGLPRHRIYVAELGREEKEEGQQYDRIYTEGETALVWGVPFVLVWHWKTWGNNQAQRNLALFDPDTGEARSGLLAVKELNDEYR